jgi:DNA-binding transcriptional LysR family regulator
MDEKDLHMLEILSEEKNITQTAKRLFFSQPALSSKIKQLEKEFGCNIIVRGPKGISFTVQGEMIIRYAHHALADLADLRQEINDTSKELRGTLNIGCSFLISKYILPSMLKTFLKVYPHVNIQLRTAMSQDVFTLVQRHQIHVGILRGEYHWPENCRCLLQEDPICIVSAQPLNLADLPQLPQIHRPLDRPLQTSINQWWQSQYKMPPYIHMEVETQDSCLQMVSEGLGYTILSELVSKDYPQLWRHRLEQPDHTLLTRRTFAYIQEDAHTNRLVETFFKFLAGQASL